MGNAGAIANGLKEAPTTLETSVDGMVDKIDTATREHTSGKFISFDEMSYPW
jgi:norsolorinic acid ketoreductase